MSTTKYEIRDGDGWITAAKAVPVKKGWLHYQLRDGTNGLAQPKNWRIKLDPKLGESVGDFGRHPRE